MKETSLAVATMFLAVAALLPSAALKAQSTPSEIQGSCQYKPEVMRYANETTLIICNGVRLQRGDSATISFIQHGIATMARFEGKMTGDKMTVATVTLRDGVTRRASGTCEIFYRNDGSMNTISCLARPRGAQPVAANFVPSRL